MRRIITLSICLLAALEIFAAGKPGLAERVWISLDRGCYVAGDRMWCSAFCFDASSGVGRLSDFSSVAYVELLSPKGRVASTKVALDNGRGAACLNLPPDLPTGNYLLISYTALNRNEPGYDYFSGARTVSVFNVFSNERDAARIVDNAEYAALEDAGTSSAKSSFVRLDCPAAAVPYASDTLVLHNVGADTISFSMSISHADGIARPDRRTLGEYLRSVGKVTLCGTSEGLLPEYDGEVIRVRVVGPDSGKLVFGDDTYAVISTPGDATNLFSSMFTEDGRAEFVTGNIFGSRDLVCEIVGQDPSLNCHLEVVDPFASPAVRDIPDLPLAPCLADRLVRRGKGMVAERKVSADTLCDFLPKKSNLVFREEDRIRYVLDDYTRFQTMQETFIEFIPELRYRNVNKLKEKAVCVLMSDEIGNPQNIWGLSLMMVDGVPVSDHARIMALDPALVKEIDIYPYTYRLGGRRFSGVADFHTFRGDLPSLSFPDNVRILDFEGASFPMAFTSCLPESTTLYWHPLLEAGPEEGLRIAFRTPGYAGRFRVTVEGVTSAGQAFHLEEYFEVK